MENDKISMEVDMAEEGKGGTQQVSFLDNQNHNAPCLLGVLEEGWDIAASAEKGKDKRTTFMRRTRTKREEGTEQKQVHVDKKMPATEENGEGDGVKKRPRGVARTDGGSSDQPHHEAAGGLGHSRLDKRG